MAEIYVTDIQLADRFGVHRATIWRWAKGEMGFPTPVALSSGCSRWDLKQVQAWETARTSGTR